MSNNQLAVVGQQSHSLAETVQIGGIFARSGFFNDAKSEAQAVVKILAGQEIGVNAFQAMNGIYIVQGRLSVSASLMAQRVKASAKYDYRIVEHTEKICVIDFYEGGQVIGRETFTLEDARRAGTQNLQKFPKNMLFARCISNGVRFYCPDVFSTAVYTPEELEERASKEESAYHEALETEAESERTELDAIARESVGVVDVAAEYAEDAAANDNATDAPETPQCHCGLPARHVKGKSGVGWVCGGDTTKCDFKQKVEVAA